ncbi:hypothetical protein KKG22_03870 [Patescibacteria group bacterium]|nr:hypothetical protein [Patescibacteria group bacterium]MBU1721282.1 hypothetical protein [Patescibacteria group bacterium]MBU1901010.1 hypothetical protein [Patescibacteria group bacterium]
MNPTLVLFSQLLRTYPYGVTPEVFEQAQDAYKRLADTHPTDDDVERVMIAFAKQIWPYLQAEAVLYEQHGEEKEREFFVTHLSFELQEKWKSFISAGGNIHDFRHGKVFEDAFTAEENIMIEEAFVAGKDHAKSYVRNLIAESAYADYQTLVRQFEERRNIILQLLHDIQALKNDQNKWNTEIDEYVAFVKRGFAKLEVLPHVEDIKEKRAWFQGQIDSGNV